LYHNLALNAGMKISAEVLFFSTLAGLGVDVFSGDFIVPCPAAYFPASKTFSVAFKTFGAVPTMAGLKMTLP